MPDTARSLRRVRAASIVAVLSALSLLCSCGATAGGTALPGAGTVTTAPALTSTPGRTTPTRRRRVVQPDGAPSPARPPVAPAPAVGAGAHATTSAIPARIWARMQGLTWHRGCTPRAKLRLVEVNFWGFDGYRHRGQLIVAARLADDVAAVFTQLYLAGYPIRSMLLPDVFGPNPNGVGADDVAQMKVGNTSAFNCRYVVGQEAAHVLSLHASGRAVDVNTWENPYVGPTGTFPDSWFLRHRPASDPAVITSKGLVVRAFAKLGWTWGGTWHQPDLQHFQR